MIKRNRHLAWLGGVVMVLGGGCTHTDPAVLETFFTDLLRNFATAWLLQ